MSGKRVVHFTESIAVASGGTALEVVTIATALAASTDHEVTVVTCHDPGPHLEVGEGVRLVRLDGKRVGVTWPGEVRKLRGILEKTDAVFVTGIWGPFDGLGLRFALPRQTKCYARICGMLQPYILNRNPWKKIPARVLYVNHNLNRADGLIVNSELEREQVASLGFSAPILLIRNGVTPPSQPADRASARADLGIGADERVMLYLGRIHPKKGLQKLLPAMAAFHAAQPKRAMPKLLVAGGFFDAEFEKEVRAHTGRIQSDDAVRFVGEVSGDKKEALFAAADVFILPSESEGLPNAALESMVRGLPVVLTPGCNLPEVATSGAGLVVDPDEAGLAEALNWITGPVSALTEAGRQGRALVDKIYGMARVVEEYDRLLTAE